MRARAALKQKSYRCASDSARRTSRDEGEKNAWIVEHIRILSEGEIRLERFHKRKGISNHSARDKAHSSSCKVLDCE